MTDVLIERLDSDRIEQIILRRLHQNRIEGYTLEMAQEIAAANRHPSRNDVLEEAAKCVDQWSKPGHVLFHTGRMTVQELQTVVAVANGIASEIRGLLSKPMRLPDDIAELVVAARLVAFEDHPTAENLKRLDAASEAFASRVPWDDVPDDFDESAALKDRDG